MSRIPKDVHELIRMFVKPEFKEVAELIRSQTELDERKACAAICDEWLRQYSERKISYISANNFATDSVLDIRDAILKRQEI